MHALLLALLEAHAMHSQGAIQQCSNLPARLTSKDAPEVLLLATTAVCRFRASCGLDEFMWAMTGLEESPGPLPASLATASLAMREWLVVAAMCSPSASCRGPCLQSCNDCRQATTSDAHWQVCT